MLLIMLCAQKENTITKATLRSFRLNKIIVSRQVDLPFWFNGRVSIYFNSCHVFEGPMNEIMQILNIFKLTCLEYYGKLKKVPVSFSECLLITLR